MGRRVLGSLVVLAGCFSDHGPPPGATTGGETGGETGASSGEPPAVCGDAIVAPPEECDEGVANGTFGSSCRADCRAHACGDGVLAGGIEGCDEGPFNGSGGACTPGCTLDACGDGYLGPLEGCDDGNTLAGDGCEADCTRPGCGDGVVVEGEECDDGNNVDTDACSSVCRAARCGDGLVREGVEGCDDGDLDPHDACTDQCAPASCGDGSLWRDQEQCDDGNTVDGDHCSSSCSLLKLYVFVTSVRYSGALGGLLGADEKCQALADAAGVQGVFRAWLSDGTQTPASRFEHGLAYTRLDKVQVADNLDAMLADSSLLAPIQVTDGGVKLPGSDGCDPSALVWTNLDPKGTTIGGHDCAHWTSAAAEPPGGGIGVVDANGAAWSDGACQVGCEVPLRLYCFQQLL